MIFDKENYETFDKELWEAKYAEEVRQQNNIEPTLPLENVVSKAVMAAQGTLLTNKYAEGYPGKTLLWRNRLCGYQVENFSD